MSYCAYWIDSERFLEATGRTCDELAAEGVMDDFTRPTEPEKRLLVLLRIGDEAQKERAIQQLRKLYKIQQI